MAKLVIKEYETSTGELASTEEHEVDTREEATTALLEDLVASAETKYVVDVLRQWFASGESAATTANGPKLYDVYEYEV